ACFVLLMLSGLSMFHPMLFFLSGLFGGGAWTRAIHPWIGIVLLISYAGLIVQFWRDNFWNRDDIAWLQSIGRVLANEEEGLGELGRFNPGKKFVYWSMALLVPGLFVTGIVIWEAYFAAYTTIETQRVALLIHSVAAAAPNLPVSPPLSAAMWVRGACAGARILGWINHVYAAIWVRGSVRGMTRGWVTPGWAWRHHRKWVRQLAATG